MNPIITIETRPHWHEHLNRNPANNDRIVYHTKITLTRRGTPLILKRLSLKWQPYHHQPHAKKLLTKLNPLLYRQSKKDKTFRPIHEAVLSQGVWDPRTQLITFDFQKKPYTLIGTDELIMVLHTPHKQLDALKNGSFVYTDQCALVAKEKK